MTGQTRCSMCVMLLLAAVENKKLKNQLMSEKKKLVGWTFEFARKNGNETVSCAAHFQINISRHAGNLHHEQNYKAQTLGQQVLYVLYCTVHIEFV